MQLKAAGIKGLMLSSHLEKNTKNFIGTIIDQIPSYQTSVKNFKQSL